MQERVSAIVPPSTTEKQENSNVLGNTKFKNNIIVAILVKSSANCTSELLVIRLTAVKYPFKMLETERKGRHTPKACNEITVSLLPSILLPIKSAHKNITIAATVPDKAPYITHFLTAYLTPLWFSDALSSATSRVHARLMPKMETVTAREYTDITSV